MALAQRLPLVSAVQACTWLQMTITLKCRSVEAHIQLQFQCYFSGTHAAVYELNWFDASLSVVK
jgi:hypothetical protein